jgi:hypothetical protein
MEDCVPHRHQILHSIALIELTRNPIALIELFGRS